MLLLHCTALRLPVGQAAGHLPGLPMLGKKADVDSFCTTYRDLAETIESGPLCITDLFKNKSVAYFSRPIE